MPARGGSKRVPRKNLRFLLGKPLVVWALEAALGAERLDRVVVSSDDAEILEVVRAYGERVPLFRPPELASDTAPAISYVQHALGVLERDGTRRYEAVAIVQPSSPLTLPEDIDRTLALLDASGADSAVSVVKLDHAIHPAKLKVMSESRLLPYLEEEAGRMAARDLPEIFVRNGSVYASRRETVEAGTIVGSDCRGYVMPRDRSVDINDEMDLLFAEFLLQRRR